MRSKYLCCALLFISFVACKSDSGDKQLSNENKMTFNEFKSVVVENVKKMNVENFDEKLLNERSVANFYVKIYNSINSYRLDNIGVFAKFNNLFKEKALTHIIRKYECKASIGMGLVCDNGAFSVGGVAFVEGTYIEITDDYFVYLKNRKAGE